MLHPLFTQSRVLYYYLSGWVLLAVMQLLLLNFEANLSLFESAIDTLVYNGVMLALSFSVWFPLAYADKTSNRLTQLVNNLLVFAAYLTIWFWVSWALSGWILKTYPDYLAFTNKSIMLRLMWGGVLFLLLAVLYHLFDFYQTLESKKRHEETMKKLLNEAELKALKAQLNPHFLFNSLNSISSLTITDPDKAREMINKLSDFLRASLRLGNDAMHSLNDELTNIERYLDIEKVRFGDRLNTITVVEPSCDSSKIPSLLLQPLFENAIKHGVYESIEPITVRTYCSKKSNALEITIINNYDPESTPLKGEGVGIENVKARLANIYQADGLVSVTRENNHFEVSLTIPQPS